VRAYASQDGCNWIWLGDACQDVDFDLGSLAWAQYIKLVDISPVSAVYQGVPNADAYDVDGIMCLNGYEENPVPAVVTVGADEVVSYTQGLRKNGTPITASRTNATNALGAPQGTDVVNFVSLGFGGSITLKYNYVVFDNPAANDLIITETSFGNPSCASYPEKAEIEGSLDGINWVSLGEVCLDGQVDIAAAGAIQYIRITDRSAASSFGGSADGYDVDGVVVINSLCAPTSTARFADNIETPNEVVGVEVYPNPFQNETVVAITTGDMDNSATITVSNYLGQTVQTGKINVASSSTVYHNLNLSGVNAGVYFISVETNTSKEVVKVIKN
ncbi:MAG: T9SS type A sorting domain-containing protein, partial [Bacteroidia bacterium]